jgi:hypothetical protein
MVSLKGGPSIDALFCLIASKNKNAASINITLQNNHPFARAISPPKCYTPVVKQAPKYRCLVCLSNLNFNVKKNKKLYW